MIDQDDLFLAAVERGTKAVDEFIAKEHHYRFPAAGFLVGASIEAGYILYTVLRLNPSATWDRVHATLEADAAVLGYKRIVVEES